jgi:hypothetical protein
LRCAAKGTQKFDRWRTGFRISFGEISLYRLASAIMAIHVICAGCGNTIAAPVELAGKEGLCPHCRTVVAIVAGRNSPPIAGTPSPAFSRSSPLKTAVMLGGALAVGAVLCGLAIAGFVRARSNAANLALATGAATAAASETTAPATPGSAEGQVSEPSPTASPPPSAAQAHETTAAAPSVTPPKSDDAPSLAASDTISLAATQPRPPEPQTPVALAEDAVTETRTWTDVTGKFTVRAQFVNFDDQTVQLRRDDGSIVGVAVDRLSQADQKFVLEQPPEATLDLPPGRNGAGSLAAATPPEEETATTAIDDDAPGAEPLFRNGKYNPPKYSSWPRLKYPDATPRVWTPYSHPPFLATFHDLEAGRLALRLPNGIVLHGPLLDMRPADLQYIQDVIGMEVFRAQSGAPPRLFDAPSPTP